MYFHFYNTMETAAGHSLKANPPCRRQGGFVKSAMRAATECIAAGIWRCKSLRSFSRASVIMWLILLLSPVFSQGGPVIAQEVQPNEAAKTPEVQLTDQAVDFFVQSAIKNNPQYLAAIHDAGAAKGMYESETMFMVNPMFSFGLNNVPLSTFPSLSADTMTSMSFMLEQEFALPQESESRKKMTRQEFLARDRDVEAMKKMLVARVEAACYDLVFLYQKKNLLVENRTALEGVVAVARSMVSVNKMNSAMLLKLEAKLSQMASEITETSAVIVRAESELENLTTQKTEQGRFVIERPEPEKIRLPSDFEPHNHPVYKAAYAMLEMARARNDHEKAKYFPSLKLGLDYMVRQPISGVAMSGDDMISFRVTAPLPLFFAIKESKSVLAAEEGVKKADRNLEEAALRLKTLWDGEYAMADNLIKIYTSYHREILPRYYASYKAMLGGLSSSQVSLLDVLDSYREYLEVSIKEAEVYRDLRKSISMLKYLGAVK